jgi:hypothetical protein
MLCLPYNARDSHNHWLGNKFGVKGWGVCQAIFSL